MIAVFTAFAVTFAFAFSFALTITFTFAFVFAVFAFAVVTTATFAVGAVFFTAFVITFMSAAIYDFVFPMSAIEFIDEGFFTCLVSICEAFPFGFEFLDTSFCVGAGDFVQINCSEFFADALTSFIDKFGLFFGAEVVEVSPLLHHFFTAIFTFAFGFLLGLGGFTVVFFCFLVVAGYENHAACSDQ